MTSTIHFLAMVCAAAAIAACNPSPDPRRTNFEVKSENAAAKYDPATGRLKTIDADTNKNGRMDSFSKWDGTRLLRIEIDRDEDGKIDRWEHFDDQRKVTRIGSSSRDDQVEDTWAYPDSEGFLARVETDTNRDGAIDKREIFVRAATPEGRVLSVVELDIDSTGQPARRLHYRPDGSFDRAEAVRAR